MKHTQGPWTVIPGQDTIWAGDGDTKVATMADLPWIESAATGRRHSDTATEQANARLIATAPDLLAALEAFVSLCPSPEGMGGHAPIGAFFVIAGQARAAIAKATV